MILVQSPHKLEQIEQALSRAAQRRGANLIAVTPMGAILNQEARQTTTEAITYSVCQRQLYAPLLSADVRFAAFLPCRIAAIREGEGVTLAAVKPSLFCEHLERPDLEHLTRPLEDLLLALMQDVSALAGAVHPTNAAGDGALGADETQMSMHGSIPQRIDKHGTKIEDLAGTGKTDSPGG